MSRDSPGTRHNLPMASTLSDAQLVARCRGGDQQAWSELVERFSRYVYAISVQAFRLPEAVQLQAHRNGDLARVWSRRRHKSHSFHTMT